jgi:uncharacterized protein YdeI (BOF family)
MKTKLGLILLIVIVTVVTAIILAIWWAPPAGDRRPVEQISIQDLLENREYYNEKNIAIEGTIISQCSRGCKFNVDDGTGVIFVQMLGEAWERPLPPSMGKTVEVRGTFYQTPRPNMIVVRPEQVQVR